MKRILLTFAAVAACLTTTMKAATTNVATFEDFTNFPSGQNYWKGDFKGDTLIKSGSYLFTNYSANLDYGTYKWPYGSEFGISKSTDTSCGWAYAGDEFNSASGSGAKGSKQFAVAYVDNNYNKCRAYMSDSVKGTSITGCYINNTSYVVDAAKGNNQYEGKFVAGDWFMLTATATKADGNTVKDSLYLIDFRSDKDSEHTYLTDWTWFDFSNMGNDVRYITFTLSGSHIGKYGLNTPTYFAMDNFGDTPATTPIDDTTVPTINKAVKSINYYTIDGSQNSTLQKGLNIVVTQYTDDTTSSKKVMVK